MVHPPEVRRERGDGRLVGEVDRAHGHTGVRAVRVPRFEGRGVAPCGHDPGACFERRLRHGAGDAAAAADHENRLVLQ